MKHFLPCVLLLLLALILPLTCTAESSGLRGLCLDGEWRFVCDENRLGLSKGLNEKATITARTISIPGNIVDAGQYASCVWFYKTFDASLLDIREGERVLLQTGSVCHVCTAYLNGIEVGTHTGSFGSFTFDITDALTEGENLLALCVSSPAEGYTLHQSGAHDSTPKIGQSVYLGVRPAVYIRDCFVQPSCEDGTVTLDLTLTNTGSTCELPVNAEIRGRGSAFAQSVAAQTLSVPAGESTHTLTLSVPGFKYWSPESPELYTVSLSAGGDTFSCDTGFKTLSMDENGFFNLNGKRYYIKSTHTASYMPGSILTEADLSTYADILHYHKLCGFNCIRFLRESPSEEVLRLCDEIGLLVYSEHPMSWFAEESERTADFFDESVRDSLLSDRNHVSLGIFGMLNETKSIDKEVWSAAREEITRIRSEAPDLLFALSSGRWDNDLDYASFSSSGSTAWDAWCGNEGPQEGRVQTRMGDVHYYPFMPYDTNARRNFAKLADTVRGVFMSEAGAGSMHNTIASELLYAQNEIPATGTSLECIQDQNILLRRFYRDYGLDRIWPTVEGVLEASEEYSARQRALVLTMIRRCANFNGHSVTMAWDNGFRGEGIIGTYGYVKRGMTEVLQDGLSDVRFCISVDTPHLYTGAKVPVEIVLSNLNSTLKAGRHYTARVRITGSEGTVWQDEIVLTPEADEHGNTSVILPLVSEKISTKGWAAGTYTIGAELIDGAYAPCGTETFYLTDRASLPQLGEIYYSKVSQNMLTLLREQGATLLTDWTSAPAGSVIFYGNAKSNAEDRAILYQKAREGSTVVFLDPGVLQNGSSLDLPEELSAADACIYTFQNWLYHFDSVVFDTPVMHGMQTNCLMDTQYYGSLFSHSFYQNLPVPDEVHVCSLFAGIDGGSYLPFNCGFQLGSYNLGEGKLVLSTLSLLDGAGSPDADSVICALAQGL